METKEFIELLKRLQSGDRSAVEKLYEEYFPKIYAQACMLLRNRQNAYDVAMNVFMKLYKYPSVEEIRNPRGLLKVMTQNAFKDYLRTENRNLELADWLASPVAVDEGIWLTDITDALTDEEREIFTLHLVWGYTLIQTAEKLQRPLPTVKRRYKEIKRKIKELYPHRKK